MADSVAERAAAKNIAGDWRERAAKIVAEKVYPALDRRNRRSHRAAADDPARRRHLARPERRRDLRRSASRGDHDQLTRADEIHQIGLQQVAEISAELDTILRSAGLHHGRSASG